MAYDPDIGKIVLFGGRKQLVEPYGDTWTYDGKTWEQQSPPASPEGRFGATMAYDPTIGKIVLFGGSDGWLKDPVTGSTAKAELHFLTDTWTYDGKAWTKQSPPVSPPGRWEANMVYDPAINRIVLFGGLTNGQLGSMLNDTWTYNGSTWTKESPPTSPPPRQMPAMAYDATLGKVVLFGGGVGDYGTWTYDGTTWTTYTKCGSRPNDCTAPPGRLGAAMDYDPTLGQIVLFGGEADGRDEPGPLNDTWTYNGTWTQQSPSNAPIARSGASMTYDASLKMLVLFGGGDSYQEISAGSNETWTYGFTRGSGG
jgi:Galactose oxidase, central domain